MKPARPEMINVRDVKSLPSGLKRLPLILIPRDAAKLTLLGAKPSRLVPKTSGWLHLTPWPEGGYVARPCWTSDPNYSCIPIYRISIHGLEMVRCDCWRVGDAEGVGAAPAPPAGIDREFRCRLILHSDGRTSCTGTCARGKLCTKVYIRNISTGAVTVGCMCR